MWPILLQCKLVGKAQEVVSSLSLEESLCYEVMKEAILRAYELVRKGFYLISGVLPMKSTTVSKPFVS